MSHLSRIRNFRRVSGQVGNGASPLSDEQIAQFAPSVFQREAHASRSERFAYIPTFEVLAAMRREGFVPVKASQGSSRVPGKADFTKHMLRFRHRKQIETPRADRRVGDVYPEVVLLNAHDGTSSYRLMSGLFRLVCLNGMVTQIGEGDGLTVHHKGNAVAKVIEGSYEVLDTSLRSLEAAEAWAGATLSRDERQALAEAAHVIRFGDSEGRVETQIPADAMLLPRRTEDRSNDLWTTFNVVQENAIRGGLSAWGRDANNQRRRYTSREITGIDQDVKVNRALWLLGERMAQLKGIAQVEPLAA